MSPSTAVCTISAVDDRRRHNLEQLLRMIGDGLVSGSREGVRGGDNATMLLPHSARCRVHFTLSCSCWVASVTELERCLRVLRGNPVTRRYWYAINERYVAAHRKPELVRFRCGQPQLENAAVLSGHPYRHSEGNPGGVNKYGNGTSRVLVERWRDGLEQRRVDEGLWLLSFCFSGTPQLPVEMASQRAA